MIQWGKQRVIITNVLHRINDGAIDTKGAPGESPTILAAVFEDGHDDE